MERGSRGEWRDEKSLPRLRHEEEVEFNLREAATAHGDRSRLKSVMTSEMSDSQNHDGLR